MSKPATQSRRSPTARCREGGFALLVALLALVGLTALATAGFLVTDTDFKVTQNHRSAVEAFYAAEAAQSDYLSETGVPSGSSSFDYDEAEATVEGGELLDLDSGQRLYTVSAAALRPDPRGGGSARQVNSVAIFTPLPLSVPGAFTAPNGLLKNGGSGTISGDDAASPGPCPYGFSNGSQPAVAGVAVPPAGYQQNGGQPVPEGDPPIDDSQPAPQLVESTQLDWPAMVSEDKVQPDYRYPEQPWPDFSTMPPSEWPIIHVTSGYLELTPEMSGWGSIILDGDVAMQGNFQWKGLILTGGRLVSDGTQTIHGAMFTGLNRALGQHVAESDVGNGNKTFRYHSCHVEAAMKSMGWLAGKPGTWHETI